MNDTSTPSERASFVPLVQFPRNDGSRTPYKVFSSQEVYDWKGRPAISIYATPATRSEPDRGSDWQGRNGYVHLAVLQDHPDLARHEVYACGAPVVVEAARRDFSSRCGLPESHFFAGAFLSKADTRS